MEQPKIFLNEKDKIPNCKFSKAHRFYNIIKPEGNRSGWHEDKCDICGLIICYDDSD